MADFTLLRVEGDEKSIQPISHAHGSTSKTAEQNETDIEFAGEEDEKGKGKPTSRLRVENNKIKPMVRLYIKGSSRKTKYKTDITPTGHNTIKTQCKSTYNTHGSKGANSTGPTLQSRAKENKPKQREPVSRSVTTQKKTETVPLLRAKQKTLNTTDIVLDF